MAIKGAESVHGVLFLLVLTQDGPLRVTEREVAAYHAESFFQPEAERA